MARDYPPGLVERVRELYADGHSVRESGRLAGISSGTAHRLMTAHGIARRPPNRTPPPGDTSAAIAAARSRREMNIADYAWLLRCGEIRENRIRRMRISPVTAQKYEREIRARAAAGQAEWDRAARLITAELAEAAYERVLALSPRRRRAS